MSLVFQYGSNATRARLLGPKRLNGHGIVVGLAEMVGDYDHLWATTSLRGILSVTLTLGHAKEICIEIRPKHHARPRRR